MTMTIFNFPALDSPATFGEKPPALLLFGQFEVGNDELGDSSGLIQWQ